MIENKYFLNNNQFIQEFILAYERNNAFLYYRNSLAIINPKNIYPYFVNYHNIVVEELIDKNQLDSLSFKNYFFSIFSLQRFPLFQNIIRIIEKFVGKLIEIEKMKENDWDCCFPQKNEIIKILDPKCKNLEKKNKPKTILMIYFLLQYLNKNDNTYKEMHLKKYDIIFLYSLPLQFHINLFQIFISEKNSNKNSENFKEELKLNNNLIKLMNVFIPIMRSPSFLFENYKT